PLRRRFSRTGRLSRPSAVVGRGGPPQSPGVHILWTVKPVEDPQPVADDQPGNRPPARCRRGGDDDDATRRLRSVRSRFRESSHELAHDDADVPPRYGTLPESPLIPRGKPDFIATTRELEALLDELRGQPAFAYDSEFIGESTYRPRLCLIQVATADRIVLIDPMGDIDLLPFWKLIGDA